MVASCSALLTPRLNAPVPFTANAVAARCLVLPPPRLLLGPLLALALAVVVLLKCDEVGEEREGAVPTRRRPRLLRAYGDARCISSTVRGPLVWP